MNLFYFTCGNFILSLTITYFAIPIIRKLGLKYGYLDKPSERKKDKRNLVRIGGLAIVTGFISSNVIFYLLKSYFINNLLISEYGNELSLEKFMPLISISLIFFLIGFIDDIFDISFLLRLALQIILSFVAFSFGIRFFSIRAPEILDYSIILNFPFVICILLTIVWLSGITNSFNWIDGLDGLAGGLAIISLLALSIFNINNGDITTGILALSLIGSSISFLRFNFRNACILMGDCGSYFIGFFIAALILKSHPLNNNNLNILPLILFIGVPLFDMTYVILSRFINNKSIFKPDRRHIHHRLVDNGMSQKETVLVIYSLNLFSSGLGLIISSNLIFGFFFILTAFLTFCLKNNNINQIVYKSNK